MMNENYDWYGIQNALVEQRIREMSHNDMVEFIRSYMFEYLEDYSDLELLDEAEVFGIDVDEFKVKEVDNG